MKYCVYCHKNKINEKKYYGITQQSPLKRWQSGNGYSKNAHFTAAIKKYGWENFEHKIIAENVTKEEACKLEKYYIDLFQTTDPNKGYNISTGGECGNSGTKRNEEQRKKFSENTKNLWLNEEYREKNIAARGNYNFTEKHKEKIRAALKGRKVSKETRDKISNSLKNSSKFHQYRKTWNKGKKYTEEQKRKFASAWANTSEETKRKIKESVSELWKDKTYRRHMSEAHKGKGTKKVVCVELDKVFNSLKEAEQKTGVKYDGISKCCHGIQKTAGGFRWRFL